MKIVLAIVFSLFFIAFGLILWGEYGPKRFAVSAPLTGVQKNNAIIAKREVSHRCMTAAQTEGGKDFGRVYAAFEFNR